MVIEYVMYFALGFLAAGLIALAIGPAIWNRAVRLTRRRIEAATPVTLSEFRADKDKLRAEHAIAVRRLEMRVAALRERMAQQIVALDAAATELRALRTERDEQFAAIGSLKLREQELIVRIRDLERDGAALAARLRQADVDLSDIDDTLLPERPEPVSSDTLSGDYRADVEDLLTALNIERQRNSYLEEQTRMLLARIEKKKRGIKDDAIAMLRDTLSAQDDPGSEARVALRKAEARIAGAESRLSALLADSNPDGHAEPENTAPRLLADALSDEDQLEGLKANVLALQDAALRNWSNGQSDPSSLRARLEAIASDVSEIVYAGDADPGGIADESLFDRVRKFAGEDLGEDELEFAPMTSGSVSERMSALRDLQDR
jgi:DNA repair exonuclease SbcCD ATPase subunit